MRTLSLKSRLTLIILLLAVTLVGLASAYVFTHLRRNVTRNVTEQQFALLAGVAQGIDDKLARAQKMLVSVARRVTPETVASPDRAQRFFDAHQDTWTIFDHGLVFLSPSGRLIAETPFYPGRRGMDFSFRDYFKKTVATGRPYISEPFLSSRPGRPIVLAFTAPVLDRQGRLIAVFAGALNLMEGHFLGEISRVRIGKTGYLYIFNRNRTMIMHPDRERMLKRDVPPGANRLFDRAIEGFEGSGETVNSRGVRMLASFKRLQAADWIVAAAFPTEEAYAPLLRELRHILAGIGSGIALALLVFWLSLKRLTRPLFLLTEHIRRLPEKEGDGRFFPVRRRDEIGLLAGSFNQMLKELDRKRDQQRRLHETYRLLAEYASDVVIWTNLEERIAYISPSCQRLFGYSPEEFLATERLMDSLIHPDDRRIWQDHRRNRQQELPERPVEFRIITRDGETRWIAHLCRLAYDEAGEFLGIRGSFSDITDRKLAEEALRQSESRYRLLVGNIPDVTWTLDIVGNTTFISASVEKVYGFTAEEVCREGSALWFERIHPDDLERVQKAYSALFTHNRRFEAEYRIRRKDGSWLWVHDRAMTSYTRDGILYADGIFSDITRRKEAEEKLSRQKALTEGLIMSLPGIFYLFDENFRFLRWNHNLEQVTGLSAGELARIPALSLIPPHFREEAAAKVKEILTEGTADIIDLPISTGERGEVPYLLSGTRIEIEGTPCVIGIGLDMTERREAEKALEEAHQALTEQNRQLEGLLTENAEIRRELEEILHCMGDMVILTDAEERIRRVNRPFQEFLNRPTSELIGKSCLELLEEMRMESRMELSTTVEMFHHPTQCYFMLNAYPVESENRKLTGFVITIRNVTELKQKSSEIAQKNRELEQAHAELKSAQSRILQQEKMASIGQLAAGVAHEINNPMGFISSNLGTLGKYLERLREFMTRQGTLIAERCQGEEVATIAAERQRLKIDHIAADAPALIQESLEGAERVRKIVQDLKSFSRLDEAEEKEADLNAGLESTINMVWNELKYKASVRKELGELPLVYCNPGQLNQVFMNMLVNAAHAIDTQGEITVRSWVEDGFVHVAISDTGCGMPPEVQRRIFEPFFTTKEVGSGTGLGLSIAYDIVKKHGGEILVESEVGKGTTFTVKIPCNTLSATSAPHAA